MKKKVFIALLACVMSFSCIAPSFVGATSSDNSETANTQEKMTKEELNKIVEETAEEVLEEAPRVERETDEIQTMGAVSVGTKLIRIFGKSYVTKKLPKKIYSKFPAAVKNEVSESAFVNFWSAYVLVGGLDEVQNTVSNYLKPYVWDWVAESAGYIAQGTVWALL
ncbi:hypothetical protein ABID56_002609 [Alkalibacillus flavidus]|uniref:Lipoprotein n=1 Tax=Alkalibacillus flavidus TaxID=546021 RepID=A0ABV2KY00_9BACI